MSGMVSTNIAQRLKEEEDIFYDAFSNKDIQGNLGLFVKE